MDFLSGLTLTAQTPLPEGYPENPETIGEHIRCARLDQGLLQRDVAEIIGVSQSTVLNWETQGVEPEVRYLPSIIAFLGFDPRPEGKTLGEKVRRRREALGLSQRKLAKQLGIDPTLIWKAEEDQAGKKVRKVVEEFLSRCLANPGSSLEQAECSREGCRLSR